MKNIIVILILTISPILAQCDWNGDNQVDVLDVVATVDCIMSACWDNIVNTVMDIDGNIYETISIGDQTWIAENLKATHYNNGDEIPTGFSGEAWVDLIETETGAFAVYPWDTDDYSLATCNGNCMEVYGNLYNWYAVDDPRGICPESYHVPTDGEWMELEMYLGMSYEDAHTNGWRGTDQGSQLSGNSELWESGNLKNDTAFNSSGFLALPGGKRITNYWAITDDHSGIFGGIGLMASFWSSTSASSTGAWGRIFDYENTGINRDWYNSNEEGMSIRCIRNEMQ